MSETITSDNAESFGSFGSWRKTAISRISTFTMPPGTTYQTPEGLRAEDEETRIAFDTQGGVYPIRESVFLASYKEAAAPAPDAGLDVATLARAMSAAYINDVGPGDGEPPLPSFDDFEAFWEPFAVRVLRVLSRQAEKETA